MELCLIALKIAGRMLRRSLNYFLILVLITASATSHVDVLDNVFIGCIKAHALLLKLEYLRLRARHHLLILIL